MTRRAAGAVVALLAFLGVARPVAAATPARHLSATQASAALQLAAQTPAVEPGGDFTARVRVSGAPAGAVLQVKVHDRTGTRSSFQQTLEGKGFAPVLKTLSVPAVPDAAGSVVITVGTRVDASGDADRLLIRSGVYPIEVALRDATRSLATLTTYLIVLRSSEAGPPLGLAVIVPLGGGDTPALQADGTTALPAATEQGIAAMTGALAAQPKVPLTILGMPERLAAVADDATRRQLLALGAGRQVAPAPFVPVDEQAWIGAGIGDDLASELEVGGSVLGSTVGEPTPTTWVSEGPLAPATATWLAGRGVHNVVVPDSALTALDSKRFNTTLVQPFFVDGVTGVRGVAADTALAHHLGATGDPVLDANHLLADLAVIDLDLPKATRIAVLEVPRSTSPALIAAVLTGVQATRTLRAGTLDELLAQVPTAGSKGETDGSGTPLSRGLVAPATASLGPFPARLRTARDDVSTYRGTLDAGDARADELDRRALAAGDRGLDADAQLARLDGVRSAVTAELAKVEAPPRQTITFTARDGVVSLTVRNTTGHTVHVVLHLDGPRLELPGHADGLVPLTLSADEGSTRVQFDVRARASGDSVLDVAIVTPDGRITLGRTRITVRSTALSNVGVVLSVGALAFLLLWWGRHTIDARRRRSRRLRHAIRPGGSAPGGEHER